MFRLYCVRALSLHWIYIKQAHKEAQTAQIEFLRKYNFVAPLILEFSFILLLCFLRIVIQYWWELLIGFQVQLANEALKLLIFTLCLSMYSCVLCSMKSIHCFQVDLFTILLNIYFIYFSYSTCIIKMNGYLLWNTIFKYLINFPYHLIQMFVVLFGSGNLLSNAKCVDAFDRTMH